MAYLGTYQLGDLLPLRVWTRDTAGTPTAPAAAPQANIFSSTGLVLSQKIPIEDRQNTTGYFLYRLNLDAQFGTGEHVVQFTYTVGGVYRSESHTFEILAGGQYEGQGISMEYFEPPAARYVLMQTDLGQLKRLKNPKVT